MILNELKNKNNIAILGFGIEGKSTLRFLLDLGIKTSNITIIDQNNIDIEFKGTIITGELYLNNLSIYDLIIKSPGISPYNDKILAFRDKLSSQTEIFFANYKGKTIGITATKGKSTVSTLLYNTLDNLNFNTKLVGNIGNPVLDEINLLKHDNYDYVIYELSSYMLETCEPACDIAVLGNIYTCHLDWHNDKFSVYEQAKLNILKNSSNRIISQDFSHYGQNLANVKYFGLDSEFSYTENYFIKGKDQLFPSNNLLLLGEHNKKNICSIVSILDIISKNNIKGNNDRFNNLIFGLEKTLKTFLGLPHRMELIANYNGITFIDDGISTTPESTIEAIKTFGSKINTLFLGGGDYGFTQESYNLLKKHIVYYDIKNLVLFPNTGLDIFNLNRDSQENNSNFQLKLDNKSINILFTDSMKKAVEFSYKNTGNNNICLMSCAAPSYSLWSGYEQKGEEFKNFIEQNKKENM